FGSLRGSWRQGHAGLGKLPTVELERQPPPSMVSEGTASHQQHLITNLGNIAIKPAVAVGKTCPVKENVRPSSRQARNGRTERLRPADCKSNNDSDLSRDTGENL